MRFSSAALSGLLSVVPAPPPPPPPAILIGFVRGGGTRSSGIGSDAGTQPLAANDDDDDVEEVECGCGFGMGGGFGREIDTVLEGGAASNSENRRNMITRAPASRSSDRHFLRKRGIYCDEDTTVAHFNVVILHSRGDTRTLTRIYVG